MRQLAKVFVLGAARLVEWSIGIKFEIRLASRATKGILDDEADNRSLGSGDNSFPVEEVSWALRSKIWASYFWGCEYVD